jgi:hypothetical protein
MIIVNLANAVRLQKRSVEAKKILDGEDWSAANPEFAICVAAVREDIDEVVKMMREIGREGRPNAEDYRSWPVFRGMRTNEKFITAFETIFGEPLLSPKPIVVQTTKEENKMIEGTKLGS